jgi:hypothetical protein
VKARVACLVVFGARGTIDHVERNLGMPSERPGRRIEPE